MRAFPLVPLVAVLVAATASAERPALKVNDIVLTDTDLKLAEQLVVPQMQRQNPGARPSPQDVMKRIVDRLIGQTLLLQAAHEATITVDSADVKAEVDRQRTRSGAAGFERYLAGLGLSEGDFTHRVEDQLVVRKFVDTGLAGGITVTTADAKTFYDSNSAKFEHPEEVKLRTILIKLDPGADEKQAAAAKERAELTRKQITSGEDMASVAKDTSDDPSNVFGGEIGWIHKGMLLPDLEPAVWALKPGELSEVLKSSIGYHIFKLEDRRAPGKVSFDEVKGTLTDILKNDKLASAIEALMKRRRAQAKIEPLDPSVKAALENLNPALDARPSHAETPVSGPPPSTPKRP